MILYLVKFVLCSAALFTLFKIFLFREKSFQFNRFALLLIIPLAALAPILSIPIEIASTAQPTFLEPTFIPNSQIEILEPISAANETSRIHWIFFAYLTIAAAVFISKSLSIYTLLKWTKQGEKLTLEETTIIISEKAKTPFSFLNTIFINSQDYERGNDLGVIVSHEIAHISQKHYLDLFFIEFLSIIFWFNPICHFIKYQVKINHEFLADQAILQRNYDVNQYKKTLFKFSTSQFIPLTSPIVSSTLKLRMTMLNKIQNNRKKNLSLLATCLLGILTWGAFAIELKAQDVKIIPTTTISQDAQPSDKLSKAAKELDELIESAIKIKTNAQGEKRREFWNRKGLSLQIYNLYKQLPENEKIGDRKRYGEMMNVLTKTPEKKTVSEDQLKDWQDAKEYGVWIDGKRVENAVLSETSSNDYSYYHISRLEKNAKNYGKHYYQVDLMTPGYFEKTYPLLKVDK